MWNKHRLNSHVNCLLQRTSFTLVSLLNVNTKINLYLRTFAKTHCHFVIANLVHNTKSNHNLWIFYPELLKHSVYNLCTCFHLNLISCQKPSFYVIQQHSKTQNIRISKLAYSLMTGKCSKQMQNLFIFAWLHNESSATAIHPAACEKWKLALKDCKSFTQNKCFVG